MKPATCWAICDDETHDVSIPISKWIKPVGKGGENPSAKLDVPTRKVKL